VKPEDIFLGPLLRRAQPELVVVCLATFEDLALRFSVKDAAGNELGADDDPVRVKVSSSLYFWFGLVRPSSGTFPAGRLLSYGIGVREDGAVAFDEKPFERIVALDHLTYAEHPLPTFFLQRKGSALTVLYGSCRKIHDAAGADALAAGDAFVAKHAEDLSRRPAVMCLGGDQIYADDVHDLVREEIRTLEVRISLHTEVTTATRLSGNRERALKRDAEFTSDDLKNHVARLGEYLALYGLSWNIRNWKGRPKQLEPFTETLPAARRLLANVPSYMIFDDHDVTDDWNLDLAWRERVLSKPLGKHIVANALVAFWLCQGFGNDPDGWGDDLRDTLVRLVENRAGGWEDAFWAIDRWEFTTPTEPVMYILDTRTQRGARDEPRKLQKEAPAFLKTIESWDRTIERLNRAVGAQRPGLPIVLVAAVPVFGFGVIDFFHELLSRLKGPYPFDFEGWVGNKAQMELFLRLFAGRNVVVLSGDVHYGYTATVKYVVFDSETHRAGGVARTPTGVLPSRRAGLSPSYNVVSTGQFIQLTSSALKNQAGGRATSIPAALSRTQLSTILNDDGDTLSGDYQHGGFVMLETVGDPPRFEFVRRTSREVRPVTLLRKRVNDAFNSGYVEPHNVGVVSFDGTEVSHFFLMEKGRHSERRWDFSNPQYWA
jgi:hypothetical protein